MERQEAPVIRTFFIALIAVMLAASAAAQDAPTPEKSDAPKEFRALKYRNIGPAAGGRVSRATGVPGNPLLYYAATASGGVWMSSDQGIFRVEHARLHAAADAVERGARPVARLAPLVFTEAEGMPNREGNRGSPGGWRLRDGRLGDQRVRLDP